METILGYITLYAPAIFAVLSEIAVVATLMKKVAAYFTKAEKEVAELKESAEYKELKEQMNLVIRENYELKKKLNVVLEKVTNVKVKDDSDNKEI